MRLQFPLYKWWLLSCCKILNNNKPHLSVKSSSARFKCEGCDHDYAGKQLGPWVQDENTSLKENKYDQGDYNDQGHTLVPPAKVNFVKFLFYSEFLALLFESSIWWKRPNYLPTFAVLQVIMFSGNNSGDFYQVLYRIRPIASDADSLVTRHATFPPRVTGHKNAIRPMVDRRLCCNFTKLALEQELLVDINLSSFPHSTWRKLIVV